LFSSRRVRRLISVVVVYHIVLQTVVSQINDCVIDRLAPPLQC